MVHIRPLLLSVFLLVAQSSYAQDITRLAGDLTSSRPVEVALELPAPNVLSEDRFLNHLEGHSLFHNSFIGTKQPGGTTILGPRFNHTSCGGCHVKDGRGPLSFGKGAEGSALIVKVGLKGLGIDKAPRDVPGIGSQLQDHTLQGSQRFALALTWTERKGRLSDGSLYSLRRPSVSFTLPKPTREKIISSIRMTPPLIGMGLLEAIPDQVIEALSDPNDTDGDGISGRINYVVNRETKAKAIGRFGFKAIHPTLKQQIAAAFFHDMGITSELFPLGRAAPELVKETLDTVLFYLRVGGVPPARDQENPEIMAGKSLFLQSGCNSCHRIDLMTKESAEPENTDQMIHPFTDLLLHDMGPGLADKRPEFYASGSEWRTTPLWGLGLHEFIAKFEPGYLHDGRARSLEEAILWHGGEAAASQNRFKMMAKVEREQLVKFLRSL